MADPGQIFGIHRFTPNLPGALHPPSRTSAFILGVCRDAFLY
jgi:hypothetical protein